MPLTIHSLPKDKISEITRTGVRIQSDDFHIYCKSTAGPPRVAIIVSVKIDKRAAVRNRIRRIIRESVRLLSPKIDAVITVRKNIVTMTQKDVQIKLEHLLYETIHS